MPRSHAALPRLYVEPDLAAGAQLTLGKDQSLYLAAVLRKSVGDEVVVFNGRDGAWLCRLASDSKKSVTLNWSSRSRCKPRRPTSGMALRRSRPSGSTM